jgi:enoyl-CoA hydratase/carnithine racemase
MPETQLGLTVSNASTKLLPLTVGPTKAREIVFTSRDVDAIEALDWGLLNDVVPKDDLDTRVRSVATDIAENASAAALWSNKRGFNHALSINDTLEQESLLRELHQSQNESIDWE